MSDDDSALGAILLGLGAAAAAAALIGALSSSGSKRSQSYRRVRVWCPECGSYFFARTTGSRSYVRCVCPYCQSYIDARVVR